LMEYALARILLIHSIILSIGGIPLIYLGDEIGTLNDYSFRDDPAKAADSRWVHRSYTDWAKAARRADPGTVEGRLFGGLRRLVQARLEHPEFAGGAMKVVETGSHHVFGYLRQKDGKSVLALANFAEQEQAVHADILRSHCPNAGWSDLVSGESVALNGDLRLRPYQFVWLAA
jgi:amylosucrase